MAHKEQQQFFLRVKRKYPQYFKDVFVLDIGSLDINGNNHFLFENHQYWGVDIAPGRNVNVVSKGHEFKSNNRFDVVMSSECFEHDMYYYKTILNCLLHLKSGGLFMFSCASTGRAEHGTLRSNPEDAPLLSEVDTEWANYYKNLTQEDILKVFNPEFVFSEYLFEYNPVSCDLYFYGIKF